MSGSGYLWVWLLNCCKYLFPPPLSSTLTSLPSSFSLLPLLLLLRNPNHQERISFNDISDYLRQSDETLTYWSQEDKSVSPKVHILGAALHSSERLYSDLQLHYKQ